MSGLYEIGLDKTAANYVPLTPLSFLKRAALVHPQLPAVIHGHRRYTWAQVYERARRLAAALRAAGVKRGETVAAVLSNTPEMYECHFGVPAAGAVLNTINVRLDPATIAFILDHGEAKVLLTDREFSPTVRAALDRLDRSLLVIDVDDPEYTGSGERLGSIEYEQFIASGDPAADLIYPGDEWDAISLNYTSGTTANPKGVVYHHRGAYLNALSNIVSWGMPHHAVYLWTLPMFHCNGWCFPWTMAANAGVNVCLRKVDAGLIWKAIEQHRVTHYCGAPIVHSLIANHAPAHWRAGQGTHKVHGLIAAAPPPVALLQTMAELGFEITHVYGLTETYGPAAVCSRQPEWAHVPIEEQALLNGRQGVAYHAEEAVSVLDPATMQPVPWDGQTMGEVMFRGNIVMKGYLKNPSATEAAFRDGWFHSGDLAVVHPDGYIKITDRAKDIIISGGENISSIEVEDALYKHPAVMLAAVVAAPDPKWGEVPHAFIELREGATVTEEELQQHCRQLLAGYKIPKKFTFGPLPKTSTGKIQKFILREQARSRQAIAEA